MAITISSAFDAGNIRVVKQDGDSVDLEIVKDHMSDFYQWFYFRLAGAAGREVTLRIINCAGSAYPHGWPDYKAVPVARPRGMGAGRRHQLRRRRPDHPPDAADRLRVARLFRALFDGAAPRSGRRPIAALDGVGYRSLGKSLDGQDIDCLTIGEGDAQRLALRPPAPRRDAWPNGGWKARSRSSPTPTIRSRGCCAANAPSASSRT